MFTGYCIGKNRVQGSEVYAKATFYDSAESLLENMFVQTYLFDSNYLEDQFLDEYPEIYEELHLLIQRYTADVRYTGLLGLIKYFKERLHLLPQLFELLKGYRYGGSVLLRTEEDYEEFYETNGLVSVRMVEFFGCHAKCSELLSDTSHDYTETISAYIERNFISAGISNVKDICKTLATADIDTYYDFGYAFEMLCKSHGISNVSELQAALEAKLVYNYLASDDKNEWFLNYVHYLLCKYLEEETNVKKFRFFG